MIALEVKLNGKRICIAGAEDLAVLSAIVSAGGKLGNKTVPARPDETTDLFYSIGGLTRRRDPAKNVHLRWKSIAPLKIGDVLELKFVETKKVNPPISRKNAQSKKA